MKIYVIYFEFCLVLKCFMDFYDIAHNDNAILFHYVSSFYIYRSGYS